MEEEGYIVDARYPSTKGFLEALTSIKGPTAQFCVVSFSREGLTLKWEHESKAMQSGIFIGHALFSAYNVSRTATFSLPLNTLLDTLEVFAPGDLGDLSIRYPGPEAELLLESIEPDYASAEFAAGPDGGGGGGGGGGGPTASIYARVRTSEAVPILDILDHFEDPCSYFIGPAALLKEAVDDIEWTQGGGASGGAGLAISLERDPPALTFSSSRQNQSLEITLPVPELSAFSVAGPRVRWAFNWRHLRAVFANLGHQRGGDSGVISKIAIDAAGKMKVTHMLPVASAGGGYGGDAATHPLATGGTQADGGGGDGGVGGAQPRLVVAQFALLALCDDDDAGTLPSLGETF